MRPVSVGLLYQVDDNCPIIVDDFHVQEWYGSIFFSFDGKFQGWVQVVDWSSRIEMRTIVHNVLKKNMLATD